MPLCVAPELPIFLAVFTSLFGESRYYVLDSVEAFFCRHDCILTQKHLLARMFRGQYLPFPDSAAWDRPLLQGNATYGFFPLGTFSSLAPGRVMYRAGALVRLVIMLNPPRQGVRFWEWVRSAKFLDKKIDAHSPASRRVDCVGSVQVQEYVECRT